MENFDDENAEIREPDKIKKEKLIDSFDDPFNDAYNDAFNEELKLALELSKNEYLENISNNEEVDLNNNITENDQTKLPEAILEDKQEQDLHEVILEDEPELTKKEELSEEEEIFKKQVLYLERKASLSNFLRRIEMLRFLSEQDLKTKNAILDILGQYFDGKLDFILLETVVYYYITKMIDQFYNIPHKLGKKTGIPFEENELLKQIFLLQ